MATKRPSLFAHRAPREAEAAAAPAEPTAPVRATPAAVETMPRRAPSREGKRVVSIYLDPLAWKQLRQLALERDTTTQALGEEAINLLFQAHRLNRSA